MINNNRIVPVTVTDLISLYSIVLLRTQSDDEPQMLKLNAANTNGEFAVDSVSVPGTAYIAAEPIKKLDISADVTSNFNVYFVPAYDFKGFFHNGTQLPIYLYGRPYEIDPDGRTLYKATCSSDSVSLTRYSL